MTKLALAFTNFPDAFDYVREARRPMHVTVNGTPWKLFPSGCGELIWRRQDAGLQRTENGKASYRVHHDVDTDRGVGRSRSAWVAEYRAPDNDEGEWESIGYSSTMAGAKDICNHHTETGRAKADAQKAALP
jgi:hypothetical protein